MNQPSGMDALFLDMETSRVPMHIASVQLLQVSPARRANFFDELKAYVACRRRRVPYLSQKLYRLPFEIDHPLWVEDEGFDIDRHFKRVTLPEPGTMAQLEAMIAALHEAPLDRAHPLWRICLIEGVQGGQVALYQAVHHACIDGVAGQTALEALSDASEDSSAVMSDAPSPKHLPKWLVMGERMTKRAVENWLALPDRLALPLKLARYVEMNRVSRVNRVNGAIGSLDNTTPDTPFNRMIGARRVYAAGRISLAEVRAIGKRQGATVNEVFLTACGGGLRRYLQRIGRLPAQPLIAGIPLSLRNDTTRADGNQVIMMRSSLETHIDEPLVRLGALRAITRTDKTLAREFGNELTADYGGAGVGVFLGAAARLSEWMGAAASIRAFNVVISNVPGPTQPRYINGARMLTHFPVSVPAHGTALNITVQSYVDNLDFGLTACAVAVPEIAQLRDDIVAAYLELRAAAVHRAFVVRGVAGVETEKLHLKARKPPAAERRYREIREQRVA